MYTHTHSHTYDELRAPTEEYAGSLYHTGSSWLLDTALAPYARE